MTKSARRSHRKLRPRKSNGTDDKDLLDAVQKLNSVHDSPRRWTAEHELEVDAQWECRDIIRAWTATHVDSAKCDWIAEAASNLAEAFLATGTHRDLAQKVKRYRRSKKGNEGGKAYLPQAFLDEIEDYPRHHAARRLRGGAMLTTREQKAPIPFSLPHLGKRKFSAAMAKECEQFKTDAAILWLETGRNAFRKLLTAFAARWSSEAFRTKAIRARAFARSVDEPYHASMERRVAAIELEMKPDLAADPDGPARLDDAVKQNRKRITRAYL